MNLETEISRELWQAVRRSYETQAWSNAILDSIHYLSDALRSKADLQSDGAALVGQALGGKAPKLKLNRLQTESERNVQSGVEQLFRGFYQAIRNPRSHERTEDNQRDADALIVFVDYLLRVIGHARTAFSVDECVRRIVDEGFVPNSRYASILVGEIPSRQRIQVALSVFQKKTEGDAKKLRYFFDAVIAELTEDERQELLKRSLLSLGMAMKRLLFSQFSRFLHHSIGLTLVRQRDCAVSIASPQFSKKDGTCARPRDAFLAR